MAYDRYFARIGYDGPRTPTLETLRALQRLHPAAIAFEGFDGFAGRVPDLDLAAVERKLVGTKRGGWCFEHNALFQDVLRSLGFTVVGLAARVQWAAPPGAITPRTHMLLTVALPDGPYIADVGFGGQTLTAPLRLVADVEQQTPHGAFRFTALGDEFQLQAQLGDGWKPTYQFSLEPQTPVDYELANWFVATHPNSVFKRTFMAARVNGGDRYGLANRDLTIRHLDGSVERRTLETAAAMVSVLDELFGVEADASEFTRLFAP